MVAYSKAYLKKVILEMLSGVYDRKSVVYKEVRNALGKLTLSELDGLYVMLLTSVSP
ncbi:hypothetical protein ES705_28073 [subsurface metagenome]